MAAREREHVGMDNLRVQVVSRGRHNLRAAMYLLFGNHQVATHFADVPARLVTSADLQREGDREGATGMRPRTLVLFWTRPSSAPPGGSVVERLPVPLDFMGATRLAEDWLAQLRPEDRGGRINMDGDCAPDAFRAYNDAWGHVGSRWEAFVGVQGWHAWVGK